MASNLGFFDGMRGMVPCRIVGWTGEQLPPPPNRAGSSDGQVVVEFTADRPGYRKGDQRRTSPGSVVLRERYTGGTYIHAICAGLDGFCARKAAHHGACRPLTVDRV